MKKTMQTYLGEERRIEIKSQESKLASYFDD